MWLRPVDKPDLPLVTRWLSDPENAKWLDFGAGLQQLGEAALAMMRGRDVHCLRLFGPEPGAPPIGLVALSDIAHAFATANLWYVLGDETQGRRGHTSRAVRLMLDRAFAELGLVSVRAWTVDTNLASTRILAKNGFRLIGRQRRCHVIDGRLHDRLLFDLLAEEHFGARKAPPARLEAQV